LAKQDLSKEIREANESGDFHLHNLDSLAPYCSGWDLYDFLKKDWRHAGKTGIKSAQAFPHGFGQIVNFIYTLSGEVAGAVSFSNFDTLVAPFIRYDNLNYQQVKQAMQEFLLTWPRPRAWVSNAHFQHNSGLTVSPSFAKQPVIIGGVPQDKIYGEFQEEMNMLNKAFYEVMLEGDRNQRVLLSRSDRQHYQGLRLGQSVAGTHVGGDRQVRC